MGARVVEADAAQDPLHVDVLADRETGRAVKRDAVVHLLETDRVPVLGVGVVLDERDRAETAIDLEALVTEVRKKGLVIKDVMGGDGAGGATYAEIQGELGVISQPKSWRMVATA